MKQLLSFEDDTFELDSSDITSLCRGVIWSFQGWVYLVANTILRKV